MSKIDKSYKIGVRKFKKYTDEEIQEMQEKKIKDKVKKKVKRNKEENDFYLE